MFHLLLIFALSLLIVFALKGRTFKHLVKYILLTLLLLVGIFLNYEHLYQNGKELLLLELPSRSIAGVALGYSFILGALVRLFIDLLNRNKVNKE
jgi:hypothetical protein